MEDKKKLIVLGALAVLILAVGAFQLTSGPAETPQPAKKKELVAEKDAGESSIKNADFAMPFATRDPFKEARLPGALEEPVRTSTPPNDPRPPRGMPGRLDFGGLGPLPNSEPGLVPLEPPKPPDVFSYSLAGMVLGEHPAALFADAAGNQRLVREGGAIDADSHLVSIARGRVTVSYKGETISITLGGNSSGN